MLKNMVDEEIEEIKKHTEMLYGINLPEIDTHYSDKMFAGKVLLPINLEEERLLKSYYTGGKSEIEKQLREEIRKKAKRRLELEEKEYGIKINPKNYTIVLPTLTRIRAESNRRYTEFDILGSEKEEGPERKKFYTYLRAHQNLCSFLSNHPELYLHTTQWHEMGHVLAFSKNIFDDYLNEEIAILYGVKGLLLGAQEGKFKIDEVKEAMKIYREAWKTDDEIYKRAFELALGDFNMEFESLEGAIQDIERRINRYVKKEGNFNSLSLPCNVSAS